MKSKRKFKWHFRADAEDGKGAYVDINGVDEIGKLPKVLFKRLKATVKWMHTQDIV